MPNTNVLEGIKCPDCGSEGPFDITASALFENVADGGFTNFSNVEWANNDLITCKECRHSGTVGEFSNHLYTIVLKSVDVDLLRRQRDYLLLLPKHDYIRGVIHLLDEALDIVEGFKPMDDK